ncbi:MAG: DUF721 domain-containing protein [Syntrophobacterales bacterium]|nr:DUF721 domain-containing protein [Syntrophobacterales bacterium]
MDHIGSIIQKLLYENKIFDIFNYPGDWKDIVGEYIASKSKPIRLRQGVLTVHVYDSVWKHHLDLHKGEILQRINAFFPERPVTRIVFKIGELPLESKDHKLVSAKPSRSKKPAKIKKPKPKRHALSEEAKRFIKGCSDPDLKKMAQRLLPLFEPAAVLSSKEGSVCLDKNNSNDTS